MPHGTEDSAVERPNRQFDLTSQQQYSTKTFVEDSTQFTKAGPPHSKVIVDRLGQPDLVDFQCGLVKVDQVLREYAQAKTCELLTRNRLTS